MKIIKSILNSAPFAIFSYLTIGMLITLAMEKATHSRENYLISKVEKKFWVSGKKESAVGHFVATQYVGCLKRKGLENKEVCRVEANEISIKMQDPVFHKISDEMIVEYIKEINKEKSRFS